MNRSLRVMALAAAALAGCGGSKAPSGADRAAVRMPEIGKVPAGVLLREQQPRFSPEVVMLGAREATEIWIPVAPLSEIDADLAKESANLQSLQVRQQLGIQAIGIANQSPQALLGLFR